MGIDPGLMAGVAVLSATLMSNDTWTTTMSTSEMPWRDAVSYVERWSRGPERANLAVRSERYTIPTGKTTVTPQLDAIMCNGALDWLLSQRDVSFALHPRAEPKKIAPDAVLKKLGWYKKTKDAHANDAARHVGFHLLESHPTLWLHLLG